MRTSTLRILRQRLDSLTRLSECDSRQPGVSSDLPSDLSVGDSVARGDVRIPLVRRFVGGVVPDDAVVDHPVVEMTVLSLLCLRLSLLMLPVRPQIGNAAFSSLGVGNSVAC